MIALITKKITLYSILSLILFAISIAFQSRAQNTIKKLTLNEAIVAGITNSKLLKASAERIYAATDRLKENNTQQVPRVNLSSSYTRISDNINPFSVKFPYAPTPIVLNPQILNQYAENLGASQLIFGGGRVKNTARSLNFLVEASKQDYANDRSNVIYNTINAFYSLYKLQQVQKILDQNIILLNSRIEDLKNLEQNGIILHNDVLKLQIQLSQLNVLQFDNINNTESTRYAFNILLGFPDSAKFTLDTSSFFKFKLEKIYNEYEKLALASRPDLQSSNFKTEASKYNIDVAKANYLPSLSSLANYNYLLPNQRVFPNQNAFKGTWNIGLTLSWDISSFYNNKHYVAEAKSNFEQNRQLQLATTDNIRTELYTNFLAYKHATEHLKLSKETLSQAQENYRILNDRLQSKLVIATDLQDAINNLIQSQLNVLQDEADIDLAYFKFIKSTGTLLN